MPFLGFFLRMPYISYRREDIDLTGLPGILLHADENVY
jgi:hypothetical protein